MRLFVFIPVLLLAATAAAAQDTLRLGALRAAALRRDPRAAQVPMLERAADLRLGNLATERLPQLSVAVEGSYQSDVASLPFIQPGLSPLGISQERYQARLSVDQLVYDGGRLDARRALERARLAQSQAGLAVERYALRREVDQAFFATALLQARLQEVELLTGELEARLRQAEWRVGAGVMLSGQAAAIEAELLELEQQAAELTARRRAALAVLRELSGQSVSREVVVVLPDLAAEVARVRAAGGAGAIELRPEYEQFRSARQRLEQQADLAAAGRRPRAVAFGQAGYGRPGLNPLGTELDAFWQAGVRVEWAPWRWGATDREEQALEIEQRIVDSREAAFRERLERRVQEQLEAMRRLEDAMATDERIIALREQTERQAQRRFEEGVLTASAYLDVRTDLLAARVARRSHRIELARARTRYLTTLGVDLR